MSLHANALNKRNNLKMILKLVTIIFMLKVIPDLYIWIFKKTLSGNTGDVTAAGIMSSFFANFNKFI